MTQKSLPAHRRAFIAAGLAAVAVSAAACSKKAPPPPPPAPPAPPPPPPLPPKTVTVRLTTELGDIDIKLENKKAPITAGNFLKYLDAGKLNGADFWRAADAGTSGFVQATMKGPTFPPIAHEPTSKTGLSHTSGAISMSRFAPGTATADFVLCVGDNTFMDAGRSGSDDKLGYAAFGHVVAGMDVVKKILHGKIDPKTPAAGGWAGQMLLHPIKILSAKRLSEEPDVPEAAASVSASL